MVVLRKVRPLDMWLAARIALTRNRRPVAADVNKANIFSGAMHLAPTFHHIMGGLRAR
jgi:hypothetical protein